MFGLLSDCKDILKLALRATKISLIRKSQYSSSNPNLIEYEG